MTAKSSSRRFKDDIFEQFARIGKAVASPRRLELLDLLCQAERTVERLAELSGQSVANTSQHLQVLRSTRLVEAEKRGQYVVYRMAGSEACQFLRALMRLGERRLAEIDRIVRRFLEGREGLEGVDRDDLIARVQSGQVTVIDVRPPEEYRAGHLPGAVSVPLEDLESRLAELPVDREVVAYCRGPYCVLAIEAVTRLRRLGYRAQRLADGVHEWRRRGLEVQVGETS